jgi:hypothetical protein
MLTEVLSFETVGSYRYLRVEVFCSSKSPEWTVPASCQQRNLALSTTGPLAQYPCSATLKCTYIPLYDPRLPANLFDSLVRPILLHGKEI